ncbi:MAG: M56 family metallopeptidase [bacterium]|nr:M56 family metallopeptidase [bacterium]
MTDLAAIWAQHAWPLCWKASVLVAVCWLATRSVTRLSAAQRHLVWTVGATVLLALPVLGLGAATWQSGANAGTHPPAVVRGQMLDGDARVIHVDGGDHADAVRLVTEVSGRPLGRMTMALFLVWLAGAGVTAGVFVLGHVGVGRLVRRTGEIGRCVRDQAEALALELGLTHRVRFRIGDPGQVPLTWGWPRSVVVLPAGCSNWDASRRRDVLLHELAHVRRGDLLTQTIVHLVCVLFWFHPLVWLMAGRLRLAQEQACDDRVLAQGSTATDYAAHLVGVTRHLHSARNPVPAGLSLGGRDQLRQRVDALLEDRRSRRDPGTRGGVLAVVVGTALALPLAAGDFGAVAAQTPGYRELTAVPVAVDTVLVNVPGRGPTQVLVLDDGRPMPHVDVLPHAEEAPKIRPSP